MARGAMIAHWRDGGSFGTNIWLSNITEAAGHKCRVTLTLYDKDGSLVSASTGGGTVLTGTAEELAGVSAALIVDAQKTVFFNPASASDNWGYGFISQETVEKADPLDPDTEWGSWHPTRKTAVSVVAHVEVAQGAGSHQARSYNVPVNNGLAF